MQRAITSGIVFAVIVAAAGCGWLALRGRLPGGEWPVVVAELESALALPGLLGLAAIDLRGVRQLASADSAQPASAWAADAEPSWPERLRRIGVDWRQNVDHVLAGVYARPDKGLGVALAAFGSFSARELETRLRESPEFEVDTALLHGSSVLQLTLRDRTSCEESGPWLLHVSSERIVVGDPDTLEAILDPARRSVSASRELEKFREFRGGRLASLAFFLREDFSPSVSNPMLGFALSAAISKLDGFRSLYVGAGMGWMPQSVELASLLEASDADVAEQRAAAWKQALNSSRAALSDEVPIAAVLLGALEISARGSELWLEADLDRQLAGELQKLPGALVGAALGGSFRELAATGAGTSAASEQLDSDPRRFLPEHAVEAIAAYDETLGFAADVDQVSGPFGFRLHSLALPKDPAQGIEVVVEALGTGLTNLGDNGERAELEITSVRGRSGQQLLAEELCGAERNDLPVALSSQGGAPPIAGSKRVRLTRGATQADIAFIEGRVKLVYPTRTETVRVGARDERTSVERNGTRLELGQLRGGRVEWKLEGRGDRLLHLRALNAAGQPLMRRSSMRMGSVLGMGAGLSGSSDFAGSVAQVEAVFALEQEAWEFPFSLTHMRPGTSREQTGGESREFEPFPIERIRRDLARAARELATQAGQPAGAETRAETHAGPFVVALESVWSFRGLMPRFEVRAPEIPKLGASLSALELSLREIRLKDGTIYTPQPGDAARWSQMLSLGEVWGGAGLRADASLETRAEADSDEVEAISGALVLRLPREVRALWMSEIALGAQVTAEGFSAVVSELARDRFVLRSREGGELLLAVRAYNAAGQMLWMTGAKTGRTDGGWQGEFSVQGVPMRIELVVAKGLETAEYPFSLTLVAN